MQSGNHNGGDTASMIHKSDYVESENTRRHSRDFCRVLHLRKDPLPTFPGVKLLEHESEGMNEVAIAKSNSHQIFV